jgi:hypothetical protein
VLIEPRSFSSPPTIPRVWRTGDELSAAVADPDPRERVRRFFAAAAIAGEIPAERRPRLSRSRTTSPRCASPGNVPLDLAAIRRLAGPKIVVSGNHREAFERLSDRLARLVDAKRVVLAGARHAGQDVGEPFNELLARTWSG